MRRLTMATVLMIAAASSLAAVSPSQYSNKIIGAWRCHIPRRPDRIVIFHRDGSWGVRNWDFSQPEDIRGRRWRIEGNRLITTAPPMDGGQTADERILSFTHTQIVTEVNGVGISYTRLKEWQPGV